MILNQVIIASQISIRNCQNILLHQKSLKVLTDPYAFLYDLATKVFIIHRNVADKLLEGTGMDLQTLQNKIDESLEPHSFPIPGKTMNIQS